MEQKENESKEIIQTHGVLTIRPAKPSELKYVIKLLKKSFPIHNLFEGSPKEIKKYLAGINKAQSTKLIGFGVMVAMLKDGEKDVFAGTMTVIQKTYSKSHAHAAFKYAHIAVNEKYRKHGVGSKLINYANNKIKELMADGKIKTARIQANVSENEKSTMNFYEKNGFHIESTMNHYYRYNEPVYVLSKLMSVENKEG